MELIIDFKIIEFISSVLYLHDGQTTGIIPTSRATKQLGYVIFIQIDVLVQ